MEAGHVGAGREHAMGLNILLPFEQAVNPIIAGDRKLVYMKYFFTRKLMFVKESDAFCLMPGGFGTLDEGLEVLTLLQTGKHDMMPVVLLDQPGGDYWAAFDQFVRRQLLDRGMIGEEDLSLYRLTDRVEEAVEEILRFYRVYHSMRYVRSNLVFRLAAAAGRGAAGRDQRPLPRHPHGRPVHARRPAGRGTRRIGPGRHAAADLPLQPPQLRPAAAVDRLHQSGRGMIGNYGTRTVDGPLASAAFRNPRQGSRRPAASAAEGLCYSNRTTWRRSAARPTPSPAAAIPSRSARTTSTATSTTRILHERLPLLRSRKPGDPDAYILRAEHLYRKIAETVALGGNQILFQGGYPQLQIEWYE